MSGKPKKKAKAKKSAEKAQASAKKETAKKATSKKSKPRKAESKKTRMASNSSAGNKKSVLGDDPLQWMKNALEDPDLKIEEPILEEPVIEEAKIEEPMINETSDDEIEANSLEGRQEEVQVTEETEEVGEATHREEGILEHEVDSAVTSFSDKEEDWAESVQSGSVNEVDLGTRLVISTVKEVKLELDIALERGGDVVLTSDNIQEVDTAGIQLLFAFRMELARLDRNLVFSSVPDKLREVAGFMSVSESMFDTR